MFIRKYTQKINPITPQTNIDFEVCLSLRKKNIDFWIRKIYIVHSVIPKPYFVSKVYIDFRRRS